MTRVFVSTVDFDKYWAALGLADDDLYALQNELLNDPASGDLIQQSGGARKIRVAARGHGKRGGARVIYVDILFHEKIYFLTAYPKDKKDDLTPAEKKAISILIKTLKTELKTGRNR
ncbi:toxin HigB-2 [Treponema primitia ZAS-2]|uniref:Toxin HigB-2 n=1 Tax=Treponema primitia (strain ATCC BAA-887 / DSM 12427 / ZAS-2) TaxID=545694 RepID=F5YJK0_TREPZ|nr:type II toxin-antitoxin system RelE/ParE family toxin [Treponema primitia]AEF87006.1 toxin HigB-2 [Treponema primitia ZAS-2]